MIDLSVIISLYQRFSVHIGFVVARKEKPCGGREVRVCFFPSVIPEVNHDNDTEAN